MIRYQNLFLSFLLLILIFDSTAHRPLISGMKIRAARKKCVSIYRISSPSIVSSDQLQSDKLRYAIPTVNVTSGLVSTARHQVSRFRVHSATLYLRRALRYDGLQRHGVYSSALCETSLQFHSLASPLPSPSPSALTLKLLEWYTRDCITADCITVLPAVCKLQ